MTITKLRRGREEDDNTFDGVARTNYTKTITTLMMKAMAMTTIMNFNYIILSALCNSELTIIMTVKISLQSITMISSS